jgi:hypothetical protein
MARRLNPPPGWPPPPEGWTPQPGWSPDPDWPDPPPGWQLWIEDGPAAADQRPYSLWAIAGGAATLIGSYLPFISSPALYGGDVRPEFRHLSATGAILLLALALATLRWRNQGVFAGLLVVAGLGALAYAGYIVMGQVGIETEPSPIFAYPTKVTFAPNIGIFLCLCGCLAAVVGAIKLLKTSQSSAAPLATSRPW